MRAPAKRHPEFVMTRLLYLIFVVALGWLLGRLLGRARRPPASTGSSRVPPRGDGTMVRDRICNTFLPRSRALTTRLEGQDHYFCSERCRRRFLEEAAPRSSRADGA